MTDFVKKTKLTELENKIPDVSSLATKTALKAVENKIPSVSSLIKKTDYHAKISYLKRRLWDFDETVKSYRKKLPKINQNNYVLKMSWKN